MKELSTCNFYNESEKLIRKKVHICAIEMIKIVYTITITAFYNHLIMVRQILVQM